MLRAAGIGVTRGVLADEANWVTRGHIQRVTQRRPLIQLKMALGADGTVPRGQGQQPVWVTGPDARAHGHLLRAKADAILVGSGTVRDDDPDLTCRLPGLEDRSPVRVVLAGRELPPMVSKLVTSARQTPLWIFASPLQPDTGRDRPARAALLDTGARLFEVAAVDGRPWLPAVLEQLVAEGITRLLVEGGPTLWRAFLDAGLADEVYMYQPIDLSETVASAVRRAANAIERQGQGGPAAFTLSATREIGPDRLYLFRRT